MKKNNFKQDIDDLAARFNEASIGAIDFGINAKAITLRDEKVRDKILSFLDEGYKLVDVVPRSGYGSSLMNFKIAFIFKSESGDSSIEIEKKGFIVTVEIPTRAVKKISDITSYEQVSDTPFSLAIPSNSPNVITPTDDEILGRRDRERDFLERLNLRDLLDLMRNHPDLMEGENTATDTPYQTTAESEVDTKTDTNGVTDVKKDNVRDYSTDYKIDKKNDDIEGLQILFGQ